MDLPSNAFVVNQNSIKVFFTYYEHVNMGDRAEAHFVGSGMN